MVRLAYAGESKADNTIVNREEGKLAMEDDNGVFCGATASETNLPASLAFCCCFPIPMFSCSCSSSAGVLAFNKVGTYHTPVHEGAATMRCAQCGERSRTIFVRLDMCNEMPAVKTAH